MKGEQTTTDVYPYDSSRESTFLTASVILLTLTAALALALPLLQGKLYLYNDLAQYHLPLRNFYSQCLKNGDDFAWMPSILCGYYAHGEGQAGMYHPFHLALYRFLPLTWAFNIELLSTYPVMFAGMTLFLRRWRLPMFAALFGAFTFTFSGFNLLHYIHMNMIAVVAHLPWLLYALDIALRSGAPRSRRRACLAIAVLTASQLLCGFPQAVYFSLLAEVIYGVCLLIHQVRHEFQPASFTPLCGAIVRCLWPAAAKVLALAMAAVQLLPSLDVLTATSRVNAGAEFRFFFSLHPANLLQFIGPYFFREYVGMNEDGPKQSHEAGLYIGALGTLLVLWVILRRRNMSQELRLSESGPASPPLIVLVRAAFALGLIGLTLALGKYTPIYPLLSHLPIINVLRAPCRHIVLVHLAASCLIAVAIADLARSPGAKAQHPWRSLAPLALPTFLGWTAAALLLAARTEAFHTVLRPIVTHTVSDFLTSYKEILLSPVLMTLATLLFATAIRFRSRAMVTLLLLVAGTDQVWNTSRLIRLERPMNLNAFTASIPLPPSEDNYRVYALVNNLITLRGANNASGYTGLELRNELNPDLVKPNTLRIAGVRWANNDWPVPGAPMHWTELPDPLPIARMVSRAIVAPDPAYALDTTDLRTTALVSAPLDLAEGELGAATLRFYRPGLIQIQATNASRQLLVVAETYHPGWLRDPIRPRPRRIHSPPQPLTPHPSHPSHTSHSPLPSGFPKRITLY
ncbi:MAG: hypothetical protein HZB26_21980 [Candidatus Hydrogenedentes bacterium]|nr:hypothetical protein [Candidatus Hydrogenedentota bacterium]